MRLPQKKLFLLNSVVDTILIGLSQFAAFIAFTFQVFKVIWAKLQNTWSSHSHLIEKEEQLLLYTLFFKAHQVRHK